MVALQELELQGESYFNFINSLQSDVTKIGYRRALMRFMQYFQIKDTNTFVKLSRQQIESYLTRYMQYQKELNRSRSSMELIMFSVNHFCVMNDIVINIKKISKFKRSLKRPHSDSAYTHVDILNLTSVMPLRVKTCVMIYASTGIRSGALTPLRLRNLKKVENLYKFTIYEGEGEEYYTFCTPECAYLIDSYLDFRTRSGEKLDGDSFLIREDFDIHDIEQIREKARPVTHKTLSNTISMYMIKAGLRQVDHEYRNQFDRKQIPLIHGFRKFFTTQVINAQVNPEIREMLLGHKIGLASCYYRPTETEMLAEYKKAINNLTVNEENRLRRKVEKLEIEQSKIDLMSSQIKEIQDAMKNKSNTEN